MIHIAVLVAAQSFYTKFSCNNFNPHKPSSYCILWLKSEVFNLCPWPTSGYDSSNNSARQGLHFPTCGRRPDKVAPPCFKGHEQKRLFCLVVIITSYTSNGTNCSDHVIFYAASTTVLGSLLTNNNRRYRCC